jgi:HK97 family phage major capsid protein
MSYKDIMEKARGKYAEAMAIRSEFEGNDVPAEKAAQINTLLDEVESLREKANQEQRIEGMQKDFETASEDLAFGRKESDSFERIVVSNEVKNLAVAAGFPESEIKASPLDLERDTYDPSSDVKRRIATLLLWKYGERDMSRHLASKAGRAMLALKDLATQPGGAGGYVVADTMLRRLVELQAETSAMRQISQVLPPIRSSDWFGRHGCPLWSAPFGSQALGETNQSFPHPTSCRKPD